MSKIEYVDIQTKKMYRAKELAEYLGVGLSTIWLYAKQKKITAYKISDKVTVFNIDEVKKALLGWGIYHG
jgi:excisionase family DNA binding protein